jgi:ribonuclease-3
MPLIMSSSAPGAPELTDLGDRLGHRFHDPALLARALAHRSWVAEHPGSESNERLEFLGDAVLGWVVADLTYRRFGDLDEGLLTDLRKRVVNAQALAEMATSIGLGGYLLVGRGEDIGGGRTKVSILSDALEAVIGAVYLDGGPQAAFAVVESLIGDRLDEVHGNEYLDMKSLLQEAAARLGHEPPRYEVDSEGPDHAKRFAATVHIGERRLGAGMGSSKKQAEREAARVALAQLGPDA